MAIADDTRSAITSQQIALAVGPGTSHVVLDHNFMMDLMGWNALSVSLDVLAINPGTDTQPIHRYLGFGIGFLRDEGNITGDRWLSREADLFVAVTRDGFVRVNDLDEESRLATGAINPDVSIDISGGTALFTPGTLRADMTFAGTGAGSLVTYDLFFNDVDILAGTRTFTLSDADSIYIGLDGRASGSVVGDNLIIAVPEPSTLALAGFGLAGLLAFRRRR